MRKIKYIVIHCTATPQNTTIESMERYWKEEKGWKNPGYHFVIKADGTIVQLLPIETPSNGVAGYNSTSINIAYIGGIDGKGGPIDNRTVHQKAALYCKVKELKLRFTSAVIQGHTDFPGVTKDCPSFDAKQWAKEMKLA